MAAQGNAEGRSLWLLATTVLNDSKEAASQGLCKLGSFLWCTAFPLHQLALFNACPGTSSQGASENELMCPQEKQTWCLPLFGLCIGLEKKWDFYVRKPSSRTPATAGQTPQRQTINRQKAQLLAQAHMRQALCLHGPRFFQPLPQYINTQRLFNTLSENRESFSHGRPGSHTHGYRLYQETCERT